MIAMVLTELIMIVSMMIMIITEMITMMSYYDYHHRFPARHV